jgi:hypothetical protein
VTLWPGKTDHAECCQAVHAVFFQHVCCQHASAAHVQPPLKSCRTGISNDDSLTLQSKMPADWQNKTGFSTVLLRDLQALFMCVKASVKAARSEAFSHEEKLDAAYLTKASLGTRVSSLLRSNTWLRTLG